MLPLVLLLFTAAVIYCGTYYDEPNLCDSDYEDQDDNNVTRAKKEFINRTRNLYETLNELWNRVGYQNIHALGREVGLMGNDIMKQVNQRLHSRNYTDDYLSEKYNCSDKELYAIKYWYIKSRDLSDKMKILFMNLRSKIVE